MAGGSPERLQRDLTTLFQLGTAAGLTDRELIGRFSRSSADEAEASFEALVTRHGPMVLRVCRNVLNDPHDAEDAFQATFLVLVKQFRTIRKLDSIGSWLYGVAARVSARARVESAKRRRSERDQVRLAVVSGPDCDALRGIAVQEEVLRLPDRYRSVVVLCYWEGLTHEQAAARLACPLGTVRSRMARARELLRRRLVRRGVVDVDPAPAALPLSSALVQSTVRAAAKVASGQAVSKVVAARLAALSTQIVRRMIMTKLGMIAVPTCLALVASIGLGFAAQTPKWVDRGDEDRVDRGASEAKKLQPAPEVKEYVVEPPDVILVEVLEALPGRPISGERLVRPDGKITLGFYGEVYVAGLTIREIKEKVVLHLRRYLGDEVLGIDVEGKKTPPSDTDRVFVDVTTWNSKVYYVQGEVHDPGRLPVTGKETILDAVNFAGGLTPQADHESVVLVRNDPKGGPPKKLRVDIDEVLLGDDASTNYYLRAGDRLVVRRDPGIQGDHGDGPRAGRRAKASSGMNEADHPDVDTSNGPQRTAGLELKIQGLERRLITIESQLRKVLEKLDKR